MQSVAGPEVFSCALQPVEYCEVRNRTRSLCCLLVGTFLHNPVNSSGEDDGLPSFYYPDPRIFTDGPVRALLHHDGVLYLGGNFSRVTGANGTFERKDCAAIDAANGNVTGFIADTDHGTVHTLAAGPGKIFIGGSFNRVNGVLRSKVAAVDPVTGELEARFRAHGGIVEGTVWALENSGEYIFAGGSFSAVDGYTRSYLASLRAGDGTLVESFDPGPCDPMDDSGKTPGGIYALEAHPADPGIVFVGGNYRSIAGDESRPFLTALRSDGLTVPSFGDPVGQPVRDLDADGHLLCVALGGWSNRVVAYDIGSSPYARHWKAIRAHGDAQTVACAPQGYVFFGFHDGLFDSTEDDFRLAVLDGNTGSLHEAYPKMNSFLGVRTIEVTGKFLAAGGDFTEMNGIPQPYLAFFPQLPYSKEETLPLLAPVLEYPFENETGIDNHPILQWSAVPRAYGYELQISRNPEFTGTNMIVSGARTEYQCAGLDPAAVHWWRVRASRNEMKGEWSDARTFTTAPGTRNIPVLASPVEGSVDRQVPVLLLWHPSTGAVSYCLHLSADPRYEARLVDTCMTDTGFAAYGLDHSTRYYWRVCALTDGGPTGFASSNFRTIVREPAIPHCLAPVNGSSQMRLRQKLVWGRASGADQYRVMVATDREFDRVVCDSAPVMDTTMVISGLERETRYYWRVGAFNCNGRSWSEQSEFLTLFELPGAPDQVEPVSRFRTGNDTLRFVWKRSFPHVAYYMIEISRDPGMAGAFMDSTVKDTEFVHLCTEKDASFWWRVCARNETGWGSRSETRQFFKEFPENRFSLEKVRMAGRYGTLWFRIGEKSDACIKIYGLGGICLREKSFGTRTPGLYRESMEIEKLPAGAYLILFEAGNFTETMNAVQVK